jgi:ubiquinone/menaquinone biosynthesis C-methylase UbiE
MTAAKNRDEIAEAYSSEPWWYDLRGFFILTFAYNSTIGAQLRFFGPNFGPEHLEVACGTGTLLEMVLRWRRWKKLPLVKVMGIDYAPSMLAGARKRFANNAQVQVQHADAALLPFPDNSYDTANIANSIHCFPTVDGALRDILRVLKPGGTLAANVLLYPTGFAPLRWFAQKINDWGIRKGILYSPFEQHVVRQKMLDAGYEVVEEFKAGNTYNVIVRKPRG